MGITREIAARELLSRQLAHDSLFGFAEYTHPNWRTAEHHRRICDALENIENGSTKRLAIFAPPRHGKSELASVRFPAWYMGRNPRSQIIATSYNDTLATDFGRAVRNVVNEKDYQKIFPGVTLAQDSQAVGRWHTNQGGVYVSTGIGGTITGRGSNCIIIDDPIKNREEADSEKIRESIWKWYTSTLYTRLMPEGAIVLMLTRWHEDDLAGRALQSENWTVLNLKAIENEGTANEKALWPEWFSLKDLKEKREVISTRDWSALYQQEPTADIGGYIKREWFKRYNVAPSNINKYIASDFAVSDKEESDATEHGVFGIDTDNNIYVIDWYSGKETADIWIDALLDLCVKHKPLAWFGEGGVIRRAVEPFLVRRMRDRRVFVRCDNDCWINPIHDKSARGRAFQAMASMGHVYLPNTRWADEIIDQCAGFPGAKHDDKFDVLSLICGVLDKAHPAIVKTIKPAIRDKWRDSDTGVTLWKLA